MTPLKMTNVQSKYVLVKKYKKVPMPKMLLWSSLHMLNVSVILG